MAVTIKSWGVLASGAVGGAVEPPPITGGFDDAVITIGFAASDPAGDPVAIGGTFHDGTIPGLWALGSAAASMATSYHGTWQIHVDGTASSSPGSVTCPLEVWFEVDSDPASRVALVNATMAAGDSLPFTHTATYLDPASVRLLMIQRSLFTASASVSGTMTFTWVP